MFPFFFGGFLFHDYNIFEQIMKNKHFVSVLFIIIFLICFSNYDGHSTFYFFNQMDVKALIVSYILAYAGGMSGLLLVYMLVETYSHSQIVKYIAKYGQYTLSIYLLQGLLMNYCVMKGIVFVNMLSYWAFSMISVFSLCVIAVILHKNHFIAKYIFGKS